MVQRILQGLDGGDKSSEASTSKFVEDGLVLQHSILEELRERFQAEETLRLTQAATALDWSKRGDEILDNMALLAGVANEISKKADSHVAQLKERQAESDKELAKVAAKAQRDVKFLRERTEAQIEVLRLATQTVVR